MFKMQKHRRFDYTPLYYRPEEDPQAKRRERIRFRRGTSRTGTRTFRYILLFIFALFIIYVLKKLASF
ncbi:MAG: hypothetical protein KDC45_12930 [Bacteroidetes bacterium]|nr:hypothetical protein [Bacteroidota bacterium]